MDCNLQTLDRDKLVEVANDLRRLVHEKESQIAELRTAIFELKDGYRPTDGESASANRTPAWTRAEQDCPGETSRSYLHRRYPTVLVYDPHLQNITARSVKSLEDQRAIFSRLPSRWSTTLHVYAERLTTDGSATSDRVRITTKKRIVKRLQYDYTIHLKHLDWSVKLRIWSGQIHWIFILRPVDGNGDSSKSINL
ncbi:MAG: hypothetical protein M1839_009383 [Geoglossum umbratile]|nr:MAG: hypothetical protein M1839_009383 [Geoglossum umbratile]